VVVVAVVDDHVGFVGVGYAGTAGECVGLIASLVVGVVGFVGELRRLLLRSRRLVLER